MAEQMTATLADDSGKRYEISVDPAAGEDWTTGYKILVYPDGSIKLVSTEASDHA